MNVVSSVLPFLTEKVNEMNILVKFRYYWITFNCAYRSHFIASCAINIVLHSMKLVLADFCH